MKTLKNEYEKYLINNDKIAPFEYFKDYVDTETAYRLLKWNDDRKVKFHINGLSIENLDALITLLFLL